MRKTNLLLVLMLTVAMVFSGCSTEKQAETAKSKTDAAKGESAQVEEIVIKADTKGSPADTPRSTNLVEAAKELNKMLEAKNDKRRVKVVYNHESSGSEEDYKKRVILAWQSGTGPDIVCTPHSFLSAFASAKYVKELDELIAKSELKGELDKIYPTLWEPAKFRKKIYGIPQDVESRGIYFRKDVLKKMGWTDDQIKAIPEQVKKGEFTLQDMITLSKQAKEKGLVKWGFFHRPNNGPEFTMMLKAFGGTVYDENTDKIVLDKKNVTSLLNYFKDITRDSKVVPDAMTSMEWRAIHKSIVEGEILFMYGGSWNWAEWQKVEYHSKLGKLPEEYANENIGFALIPAPTKGGKPVTLSQPYMYMVSSKSKNPDLAFNLAAIASKSEYNATHAVESGHLTISPAAAQVQKYKDSKFLESVTYMLEYTTTQPNHQDWGKFTMALFKSVQAVELGKQSPEEAVRWLEEQLKNDLGDNFQVNE